LLSVFCKHYIFNFGDQRDPREKKRAVLKSSSRRLRRFTQRVVHEQKICENQRDPREKKRAVLKIFPADCADLRRFTQRKINK